MLEKTFTFDSTIWIWNNGVNKGSWYFVSLPTELSQEISDNYPFKYKGFGSAPTTVSNGESMEYFYVPFKTSKYLYHTNQKGYRLREKLDVDETITVRITHTI